MRVPLPLLLLVVAATVAAETPAQDACTGRERIVRRAAVTTAFIGGNAALYVYFDKAWWSGEKSDFWFNNDWDMPFRDQDKAGHLIGGYHLARFGEDFLRFACVSPRKAVFWSAAYATAFQLQIEIWDARQKLYGFSPPDVLFNTAGAAWSVTQHFSPTMDAFRPTLSYRQTRMRKLAVGENANLRWTTDYAGQTYWVSVNPDDLLGDSGRRWWPGLFRVSVGHSVTEYRDAYTGVDRRGKRVIALGLDVDPRRLPGDHPLLRALKNQASYYRFPAPAIVIVRDVRFAPWYR